VNSHFFFQFSQLTSHTGGRNVSGRKLLSLTSVNSPPTPCQAAGQTETITVTERLKPLGTVWRS